MTKATQKSYDKATTLIADEALKLNRLDYIDFIEELAAHIRGLDDCIREEEAT